MPEFYDIKYMGGHVEYPKSSDCRIYFYYDRIELENPRLIIPYQSITNIQNADEKTISALRVVMFGIVGALWKKKHLYTIIQYKDSDERIIVIDFIDLVDTIQPFIYRKMVRFRRPPTLSSENGNLIYENKNYDFSIKYPETWYEDELNQNNKEYYTVVEFRKFIEDKPPFVTIYVYNLSEKVMSVENIIQEGIKASENDPTTTIIDQSKITVDNKIGVKLVDVDTSGYKRMVFWIPSNEKVYELSYSTKQEQYLENLPVVERMMNSFRFLEKSIKQPVTTSITDRTRDESDPLLILKRRFANGEINDEQYQRMKHVLQE